MSDELYLGLDFGTESVRALLADRRGRTAASAVAPFEHGQIVPGSPGEAAFFSRGLPPGYALQHPAQWCASAAEAVGACLRSAGVDGSRVGGIGVDFTSCTVLPCDSRGLPLCLTAIGGVPTLSPRAADPHAWPKLWKHHGAVAQTRRLNELARARAEPWLGRYGGIVGLEWLFPKLLEVTEEAPDLAAAIDFWIEGGDWFVWFLVGGPLSGDVPLPPRSTCQAGYKGCWSPEAGYPSAEFCRALHPSLAEVRGRALRGTFVAPGRPAGALCERAAAILGLPPGVPVSAAIIDAHAGVPGAGVGEPGTLVMVLGTSACHMLMSNDYREIAGVAGVVRDGILPGLVGYETGQAAVGDAFDLVRRLTGGGSFGDLDSVAGGIEPGAQGVLCLDWFNGCRTPLMDGSLTGVFTGLSLHHGPGHLYRAALEASAMGLRWIVETLRGGGAPIDAFVATGGLPRASPLFMKIIASALGAPVRIHGAEHGPALGAAILGAVACGAFPGAAEAVRRMAGAESEVPRAEVVPPDPAWADAYDRLYRRYRHAADQNAFAAGCP